MPAARMTKTDTPSSATTYSTSAVSAGSRRCTSSLDTRRQRARGGVGRFARRERVEGVLVGALRVDEFGREELQRLAALVALPASRAPASMARSS